MYNSDSKESACKVGESQDAIPGLGRSPGRGAWQSTPVFLPREISMDRGAQQATVHEGSQRVRHFLSDKHAHAAAAAKSLQSCLTLCDPIDSSPPGFAVPGILQARTLKWVAISFSNA